MKIILSIFCTLCFFADSNPSFAQERGEVPPYVHYGSEKPTSIDAFITQYQKAWRNLDADLFTNLHAEDTEWTNAFARIFRGRNALKGFVERRLFPQFKQIQSDQSALRLYRISSRILTDSVAVLHLYTDYKSITERSLRRVHFHLVLNNEAGRWEIVHSAIMDPRQ